MRATVLAIAVLLSPAASLANPVSAQVLRVRQLPGSLHVQLSFAALSNLATPTAVTRDGAALSPTWTALAGLTVNSGSGLTSMPATQACDCSLAVGAHEWVVTAKDELGKPLELRTTVEVKKDYGGPPPARDLGGSDLARWDIPEPAALQGLDCRRECAAGGAGGDKESSGCALAPAAGAGSLALVALALVALAGLTLALRRRAR